MTFKLSFQRTVEVEVSATQFAAILDVWANGGFIPALKHMRQLTGCSLREGKTFLDEVKLLMSQCIDAGMYGKFGGVHQESLGDLLRQKLDNHDY